MNKLKTVGLVALGALLITAASSWGFLVHRTATQLAIYHLPKNLQSFFWENKGYVVKYSVRPDQRRNDDKTEGPKHFIDLEPFGDSAAYKMPVDWNAAVAKYTQDSLEKYGYVPYWVINMQDKLTNAFRKGERDSILFYATDLAHYIEDAHVPLHTSVNHDGQLTGQKGLHSLWESMIPEIELTNYNLYSRHKATYVKNPEETIWNAVRGAHALLPELFAEEKEASKNFTDSTKFRVQLRNGRESKSFTSAFTKAYSEHLGKTVNQQLLRSADLVADFWYTAWVNAGKPDVKALLKNGSLSKEEKKEWKKEQKAFKKNALLKDNLLMAKENNSSSD